MRLPHKRAKGPHLAVVEIAVEDRVGQRATSSDPFPSRSTSILYYILSIEIVTNRARARPL